MTKQKQAILCPNCKKLISRDEPACPHCHTTRPGAFWKNNAGARVFFDPEALIKAVIYINVGMYLVSLFLSRRMPNFSLNPLLALSPERDSLILLGATGTYSINQLHNWWSLVSANYLHGGLLHIFFNMMAFMQVAPLVIREFGMYRLMIIYTFGGIAGFLVSYLAGVNLTIGASAAICSLLGALLFYGWSRGGIYGQVLFKQIGGWIIFLFIFGLIIPGINNWGHGGGIIGGVLLTLVLGYNEKRKENSFHKGLGVGCAVMTVLVLVWAVGSGVFYRFVG